jgi:hypothetical protein
MIDERAREAALAVREIGATAPPPDDLAERGRHRRRAQRRRRWASATAATGLVVAGVVSVMVRDADTNPTPIETGDDGASTAATATTTPDTDVPLPTGPAPVTTTATSAPTAAATVTPDISVPVEQPGYGIGVAFDSVWVGSSHSVYRIDATTGAVQAVIPWRHITFGVVGTDEGVWVIGGGDGGDPQGEAAMIDPATNEVVASLDVETPRAITAGDGLVFVASVDEIVAIDPRTAAEVGRVRLRGRIFDSALTFERTGKLLAVTAGYLVSLATSPLAVLDERVIGRDLTRVAGTDAIWLAGREFVAAWDPETSTLAEPLPIDGFAAALAVAPDGSAWSASSGGNDLVRSSWDRPAHRPVPVGAEVTAIAVTDDFRVWYVDETHQVLARLPMLCGGAGDVLCATLSPDPARPGDRVMIDAGPQTADAWRETVEQLHRDGSVGYFSVHTVVEVGGGACELIGAVVDPEMSITDDGRLAGAFTVPSEGFCFQGDGSGRPLAPGRYWLVFGGHTSVLGTLMVGA